MKVKQVSDEGKKMKMEVKMKGMKCVTKRRRKEK